MWFERNTQCVVRTSNCNNFKLNRSYWQSGSILCSTAEGGWPTDDLLHCAWEGVLEGCLKRDPLGWQAEQGNEGELEISARVHNRSSAPRSYLFDKTLNSLPGLALEPTPLLPFWGSADPSPPSHDLGKQPIHDPHHEAGHGVQQYANEEAEIQPAAPVRCGSASEEKSVAALDSWGTEGGHDGCHDV